MQQEGDDNIRFLPLAQAVVTMQNLSVPSSERRAAAEFLENIKSSSSDCEAAALWLSSPAIAGIMGVDDKAGAALRLSGLNILEHCVKTRWNTYSAANKQRLKQLALERLLVDTLPIETEPGFIQQKLGSLVAEMIKREWPQQWPTLVPSLIQLSRVDQTRCTLVLIVFQVLIEDVLEFNESLPLERRRELRMAIVACLPTLLPALESFLASGSTAAPGVTSVLLAGLKVLAALIPQIPVSSLLEHHFLDLLLRYLTNPAVRGPACDCLIAIFEIRDPKDSREELLCILLQAGPSWLCVCVRERERERERECVCV
jgi:exportin-5